MARVSSEHAVRPRGHDDACVGVATIPPRFAAEFTVGGLPAVASDDLYVVYGVRGTQLPVVGDRSVVRPGDEVTVVGAVDDGVLRLRVVAVPIPAQALIDRLAEEANTVRLTALFLLAFGLAVPLVVWKSRTVRSTLRI